MKKVGVYFVILGIILFGSLEIISVDGIANPEDTHCYTDSDCVSGWKCSYNTGRCIEEQELSWGTGYGCGCAYINDWSSCDDSGCGTGYGYGCVEN